MADLGVFVYGRSGARSQIMPPALTMFAPDETLHVREAVTVLPAPSGLVAFVASPGHYTAPVTDYSARISSYPAGTFVDSTSLGVPTPDGNNMIVVDLTTFFGAQADGDYTLVIRATSAGGSDDSSASDPFTLPLP